MIISRSFRKISLILIASLSIVACGDGSSSARQPGPSSSVRGEPAVSDAAVVKSANISCSPGVIAKDVEGKCFTQCSYQDNGQTTGALNCRRISWESGNPAALKIDAVTGEFVGMAPAADPVIITARSARDTQLLLRTAVRVSDQPCEGLTVYPVDANGARLSDPGVADRLSVIQGTTQKFRADCTFANSQSLTGTAEVTRRALWSSSDPDVAEIFDIDDINGAATDSVGIAYTLRTMVPVAAKASSLPAGRNAFRFGGASKSALITGEYCGVSSFNLIEIYPAIESLCVERSFFNLSSGACIELPAGTDTSCTADNENPEITVGGRAQFYALGIFKATSPRNESKIYRCNVTNDPRVTWSLPSAADASFISVSNRGTTGTGAGLVTGVAVGTGNLKANYVDQANGVSGISDQNQQKVAAGPVVNPPSTKTLTRLDVAPKFFCVGSYDVVGSLVDSASQQNPNVLPGSKQMEATATYSDASTKNVVSAAGMMWSTGAPALDADGYWDGTQCVAVPPSAIPASSSPVPFAPSATVSGTGVVSPTGVLRIGTACIKGVYSEGGVSKADGATVLVLPITNVNTPLTQEVCQTLGEQLQPLFLETDGGAGPLPQVLGNLLSATNPLLTNLDSGATTGPSPTCGAAQLVNALLNQDPAAIAACSP